MSSDDWHTSIGPKVKGTWNLHHALQRRGKQPDFFVIMGSISGSVGTATESNYCAANAFQDSFARYRRGLSLPAISVGLGMISEVGYLHEHPDIEALLLRKGIHPITEDEFLQIMDIALTQGTNSDLNIVSSHFSDAHILTGLETTGLHAQRKKGFEGGSHLFDDRRAVALKLAMDVLDEAEGGDGEATGNDGSLPAQVASALAECTDDESHSHLSQAVQEVVRKKVCNLLLLSEDELDVKTQLGNFGMDSMLAAEFRRFIMHALEVDVPFSTLLNKQATIESLAEILVKDLLERQAQE